MLCAVIIIPYTIKITAPMMLTWRIFFSDVNRNDSNTNSVATMPIISCNYNHPLEFMIKSYSSSVELATIFAPAASNSCSEP